MSKRWFPFISFVSLSGSILVMPTGAIAAPMPLTQATLRKVVKDVKLFLGQQPSRTAQINDRLGSGDALKTARASRAELKFNDGTLAKVGEYATFRFTPNTRRFDLQNGTYLFLVPPGRGTTEFYTPNARAGVRGSALFLRYDAETETTTMGALTNNPLGPMDITVGGQQQPLYAGQMAIVVKNKIDRVETFDLRTFYNTSALFKDVDLSDPEVQAVRLEMSEALQLQSVLQNGSALSQTPTSLNPSTAAPAVILPIASPTQPMIDPSIAQLRDPPVVQAPPVPSVIKTTPTPLPTGNPVNSIENPIPIVPRPLKEDPTVIKPIIGEPIETATPTEATPTIKAEPTSANPESLPVKAEPVPISVESLPINVEPAPVRVQPKPIQVESAPIRVQPKPIQVEPASIKVQPKPIQVEPIVIKAEPKPTEPLVIPKDRNPIKIIIPKIDVTFSTPKTDVKIETPRIEIVIQPTKTHSGDPGIPTIEIPKFDAPKITEMPKVDSPKANARPNITVDLPVNIVPISMPAPLTPLPEVVQSRPNITVDRPANIVPMSTPTSLTPSPEVVRSVPDMIAPSPQTLVIPVVTPATVTPVVLPIVQQDMPIMKPTIVQPILIPVVPVTPVMLVPVKSVVPEVTPIVVPIVTTVIPPPPTAVTSPPTVVNPISTVVTLPPTVVTPTVTPDPTSGVIPVSTMP